MGAHPRAELEAPKGSSSPTLTLQSGGQRPGEGRVTPVLTSPLIVKPPPTLDGQG